jgi:polysaccharide deacetylase 2 family uncharacterized protein YibQ
MEKGYLSILNTLRQITHQAKKNSSVWSPSDPSSETILILVQLVSELQTISYFRTGSLYKVEWILVISAHLAVRKD